MNFFLTMTEVITLQIHPVYSKHSINREAKKTFKMSDDVSTRV